MKAWLEIKYNNYDDCWDVKVTGKGKELFYENVYLSGQRG